MKAKKESAFAILWRWAKKYHSGFIGAVLLAVIGVALGMLPYFCIAQVFALLLSDNASLKDCLFWCLIALAGYAGKVIFSSLSTALSHTATYHTLRDLRKALILKLSKMPMGDILNTPSGQYKTTIVDRVEGMEPTLAHLLPEMTSNLLVPAAILIYLFILDWRMALIALIPMAAGIFFVGGSSKNYAVRWEGAVKAGRDMANAIVEYIGGIQVVKAFSQSAGSYKKYADAVNCNAGYYVGWMRDNQKYMCMWTALLPSVFLTVLPAGFIFWSLGTLSVSGLMTVIILSLGVTGPIIAAMSFMDDLAVVGTNVEEISSILNAPELSRPDTSSPLSNETIAFENVSFAYHKDSGNILHDISFEIKPQTVTALVGPSGSGKSTIAKLLAGFWDVSCGRITLGGTDLKEISFNELNRHIAYVSQDNYLFNRTIRENIRMGRPDASDREVLEAAVSCGCDDFIRKLPDGYETVAGGGGSHLSGGEKQRIAIARAMLKDAPIIILDEATASIDPECEAAIQSAISALTRHKTLIVIAHRLSTITDSDNILVIEHGRIKASGTHQSLLSSCPLYQSMWSSHLDARDETAADTN